MLRPFFYHALLSLAALCAFAAPNITVMVTLPNVDALRAQSDYYSSGYAGVTILSSSSAAERAGGVYVAQGKTNEADDGGVVVVDAAQVVWKRSFGGAVNVLWYGADPTGASSSYQAFTRAVDYASTINEDVLVPSGHYTLDQGLELTSHLSMFGEGAVTLDFRTLSSGTALSVGKADPYYNPSANLTDGFQSGKLANMLIVGSPSATGILLAGANSTYATPFYTLEKLDIKNFNINVEIGQQTWLNGLFSCALSGYAQYGLYISDSGNEGEEISVYNSAIFNGANANAIGLYVDRGSSVYADVSLFGSSFDFNAGRGVVVNTGQARFFGCHFEGDLSVVVNEGGYAEFFGDWFLIDQGLNFTGGQTNIFGGYLPDHNIVTITNGANVTIVDRQT